MDTRGFLRKLGVGMLALLLFLCSNFFFTAHYLDGTVLDADFLIEEFGKYGFYDSARQMVLNRLFESMDFEAYEQAGLGNVRIILEDAFNKDWLKPQVDGIMRSAISYLRSETSEVSLVVSIAEVKANIASQDERFGILVEGVPDSMDLGGQIDTDFLETPRKHIRTVLDYKMHALGMMALLSAGIILLSGGFAFGLKRVGTVFIGFIYFPIAAFIIFNLLPELLSKMTTVPAFSYSSVNLMVKDYTMQMVFLSLYYVGAGAVLYVTGTILGGKGGIKAAKPAQAQ